MRDLGDMRHLDDVAGPSEWERAFHVAAADAVNRGETLTEDEAAKLLDFNARWGDPTFTDGHDLQRLYGIKVVVESGEAVASEDAKWFHATILRLPLEYREEFAAVVKALPRPVAKEPAREPGPGRTWITSGTGVMTLGAMTNLMLLTVEQNRAMGNYEARVGGSHAKATLPRASTATRRTPRRARRVATRSQHGPPGRDPDEPEPPRGRRLAKQPLRPAKKHFGSAPPRAGQGMSSLGVRWIGRFEALRAELG